MSSFESCGLIDLESKLVPGSSAENRAADRRWQSFAINSLSIDPFVLRTVFVLPLISSPIVVSSSNTSANRPYYLQCQCMRLTVSFALKRQFERLRHNCNLHEGGPGFNSSDTSLLS